MARYQEKINVLEAEIVALRAENREKSARIEELKAYKDATESNERECSSFCEHCVHGIKAASNNMSSMGYAPVPYVPPAQKWLCELECKCKGFVKR